MPRDHVSHRTSHRDGQQRKPVRHMKALELGFIESYNIKYNECDHHASIDECK